MIGVRWETQAFKAAANQMLSRLDSATGQGVSLGMLHVRQHFRQAASGRPGPIPRSQKHRDSFEMDGPRSMGRGYWEGNFGPTMVYSRALELGHPRWPAGVRYPSLGPGIAAAKPGLVGIFVQAWSRALG